MDGLTTMVCHVMSGGGGGGGGGHTMTNGQTMEGGVGCQQMDSSVGGDEEGMEEGSMDLLTTNVSIPENDVTAVPADDDSSLLPSTTTIKHEIQQIERTVSSESDEQPQQQQQQYHHVKAGGKENNGEEQYGNLKVKESDEQQEAPVQRKLFGPPCWNPEQLVAAIESVKNGISVSASARKFGIPRTTLSNKIYGRRRKIYNTDSSAPYTPNNSTAAFKRNATPTTTTTPPQQDSSLTYVIGSENERLVADIISKQKHVDSFSMTRAVFDIVKYLANEKGHVLKDDEEVKEWIQYFFIRYPTAYFPVTLFELRLAHSEDEYFADFVFDASKNNDVSAEDVLKKLMSVITRRLLVEKKILVNIHLFWWYTFLTIYTDVRDYFLDNLTWPDTILNPANLQMVDEKGVHQILTCTLLKRTHHGIMTSYADLKRSRFTTSTASDSSDSPTQVTARRSDLYENPTMLTSSRPSSNSYNYPDDNASQDANNISSTSTKTTTISLGKMLALEALSAVERKISAEELRYFKFRYDNPRLDDAYQVWRNLKVAAEKDDDESTDGNML